MKKNVTKILLAGALSASMAMPAMAAPDSYEHGGGVIPVAEGTDVYAGIYIDDLDAQSRIHVEVPTLFGFVVNGTIKANDQRVVSQVTIDEEGTGESATIMLPNMLVTIEKNSEKYDVNTPGALDADGNGVTYTVGGNQSGNMKFKNYSTKAVMDANTGSYRFEGQEIELLGYVDEGIDTTDEERNYWSHVQNAAAAEGVAGGFKQYTVYLDGKPFSTKNDSGWYGLAPTDSVTLQAPDLGESFDNGAWTYSNLDTDTNLASTPYSTTLDFNVRVGGRRDQYKQIEESAKVGTIVWTAAVKFTTNSEDIYGTNGDKNANGYLDGKYDYDKDNTGKVTSNNNDVDGMRSDSDGSGSIDDGTKDNSIGKDYTTP